MNIDKNWWEQQPKWSSNLIPSNNNRKTSRHQWVFFIILLAFVSLILYDNHLELLEHYKAGRYTEMQELVVLVFPILFLLQMLKRGQQRRRFGDTPFFMKTFPAVLGERFSGNIEIKEDIKNLTFTAELLLMQHVESEKGDNANTQEYMVWKAPLELIIERAMLGTRLLIDGQLPADKPPSEPYGENNYFWKLYVYSNDKSFKRAWDVPIITANDYV